MSLRSADAYIYASFRATLAESDCSCVLRTGDNAYTILPVLIEDGGEKLYVEIEYRFYDPKTLPNFVRFELRPDERAKQDEAQKLAEPAKPKTYAELQQRTQREALNTLAARYQQNKQFQLDRSELSADIQGMATAAQKEKELASHSKGQRT